MAAAAPREVAGMAIPQPLARGNGCTAIVAQVVVLVLGKVQAGAVAPRTDRTPFFKMTFWTIGCQHAEIGNASSMMKHLTFRDGRGVTISSHSCNFSRARLNFTRLGLIV